MKLKKTLSVLLVGILALSAFCYPLSTIAAEDYSYKIDKALAEKLETMDDDDEVPVSVWVEDIDHEAVKAQALAQIKGKVSDDVYEIAKADGNTAELLRINEKESKKSIEQQKKDSLEIQKFVFIKRKISANIYTEQNNTIINNVICPQKDDKIKYVCKYAPNAELLLKKNEIRNIIEDKDINMIYYSENIMISKTKTGKDTKTIIPKSIKTDFYRVTGLSTARDAFGLDGDNMKVGLLEPSIPDPNYVTDHTTYNVNDFNSSSDQHPTIIAKLMVGHINGYVGPIPSATLYYGGYDHCLTNVKECTEKLIDNDVTAINCSFGLDPFIYNEYGDYSRWYDHISIEHNIHMIFAAGNDGSVGVTTSNMTYNSIVVGNCNNDGEIHSTSSYNTNIEKAYKPDLVAPGTGGNILPYGPSYAPATSFSAPLVTSAVIQMAQVNAILKINPRLMKALLLSSSKITNFMSNEPIFSQENGSTIALSRSYGAGMLSVTNAYIAFHDKNYYLNSTLPAYSYHSSNLTKVIYGLNKKVRFTLCWDKKVETPSYLNIYGDHLGDGNDIALDKLKLLVITPSGKIYRSAFLYDNKQMITIENGETGTYQFSVIRMSSTNTADNTFSICISTQ